MDENKFLGESSSSTKSDRSLANSSGNNNNNNNNNNHNVANNTSASHNSANSNQVQHRPSSSNSSQIRQHQADDTSDGGDDVDSWECSLCTFQNSADKFKCEMCDLRRGTSTRKPRCNADTIVAQVVKQQEQIRQQTVVKPPKTRPSNAPNSNSAATSSNDSNLKTKAKSKPTQDKGRKSRPNNDVSDNEDSASDDLSSPKPKRKRSETNKSRKRDRRPTIRHNEDDGDENDDESTDSESTDVSNLTDFNPESPNYSSLTDSPEPATSPPNPVGKTADGTFKPTPMEVNGNLIKYSPPTSSGRTGLIIDKKRFTQHSVTVDDVTITFTEFATRQNRYVRKKKRSKSRPKPSNNNGSACASDH